MKNVAKASYRRQLLNRLGDLGVRLERIDAELETHADPNWFEQAVERETDEVLEGLGLAGQQEIRMIRAALGRIADGSYGRCTSCGEPISEDRLSVLPATPFCRSCAQSVAA
jgi:RNA polymerase-binding transcription factor DksA